MQVIEKDPTLSVNDPSVCVHPKDSKKVRSAETHARERTLASARTGMYANGNTQRKRVRNIPPQSPVTRRTYLYIYIYIYTLIHTQHTHTPMHVYARMNILAYSRTYLLYCMAPYTAMPPFPPIESRLPFEH